MEQYKKELMAEGRYLCVDRDGNVFKNTPTGMIPLGKHTRNGGYVE